MYRLDSKDRIQIGKKIFVVEGEVRTCSENDRVEWVVPTEIPWEELAFPSTEAALRDFLSGRGL